MLRQLPRLLTIAATGLLSGCGTTLFCGEDPEPICSIPATVQYPVCQVASCAEHPTLLTLQDGQQLRPFGPDWDTFLAATASSLPEQVLISYQPEATPAVHTWHNATITCISAVAE